MKKVWLIIVTLMALALFAEMALADDFDVTISKGVCAQECSMECPAFSPECGGSGPYCEIVCVHDSTPYQTTVGTGIFLRITMDTGWSRGSHWEAFSGNDLLASGEAKQFGDIWKWIDLGEGNSLTFIGLESMLPGGDVVTLIRK